MGLGGTQLTGGLLRSIQGGRSAAERSLYRKREAGGPESKET